jgi:hypothetical protein
VFANEEGTFATGAGVGTTIIGGGLLTTGTDVGGLETGAGLVGGGTTGGNGLICGGAIEGGGLFWTALTAGATGAGLCGTEMITGGTGVYTGCTTGAESGGLLVWLEGDQGTPRRSGLAVGQETVVGQGRPVGHGGSAATARGAAIPTSPRNRTNPNRSEHWMILFIVVTHPSGVHTGGG